MNKKLVAQFMASVDPFTLPTDDYELEDLDEFEVQEVIEQSIKFQHDGQTMYVIPGIQRLNCYVLNDGELEYADYTPTYEELSDLLEEQGWNGDWIDDEDVEEAMGYLPMEN